MMSKPGSSSVNLTVVVEGFAVHLAAQALLAYVLFPAVVNLFPSSPPVSLSILSTSALAPLLAACYVLLRARWYPAPWFRQRALAPTMTCLALGLAIAALATSVIPDDPYTALILKLPPKPRLLTLLVVVIWIPMLEEVLYRGYILEILSRHTPPAAALVLSSFLFIVPHAIWGAIGLNLVFLFVLAVVLGLSYLRGGLASAILVHLFYNLTMVLKDTLCPS